MLMFFFVSVDDNANADVSPNGPRMRPQSRAMEEDNSTTRRRLDYSGVDQTPVSTDDNEIHTCLVHRHQMMILGKTRRRDEEAQDKHVRSCLSQ